MCLNYKDEIIKRFLFKETVSVTFYLKNGLTNKIGSLHDAEQYYKYSKLLIIRGCQIGLNVQNKWRSQESVTHDSSLLRKTHIQKHFIYFI